MVVVTGPLGSAALEGAVERCRAAGRAVAATGLGVALGGRYWRGSRATTEPTRYLVAERAGMAVGGGSRYWRGARMRFRTVGAVWHC